ncbi:MAG: hypothetical protein OEW58_07655, partial [Gammaproteobacteria bacterium]|nr:hypothetical protein [Gammaproteobacteria bacterium]
AKWVAQHSLLFAVRHASLEFKRTAKYDDLLAVKTELISSNRLSLHFRQEIYRMRAEMLGFEAGWNMPDGMDELVCEGLVKIVVLSADGMQPKRMSVELLEEIIS